ncbi:hypothetical protein CPC08DRAFT_642253 [Agrocybe pediades]|nr:hypothetical protein CPC08DRAFT_642253 [Agrocybe pediades]
MALDEKRPLATLPDDVDLLSEDDEKARLMSQETTPVASDAEDNDDDDTTTRTTQVQETRPSPLKRFALIVLLIFACWMGFQLCSSMLAAKRKPRIIYASRYSKEHKFRPAASPIITETLKDGRIRLRGALPTEEPKPPQKKKTGSGKKKGRKTKRKTMKRK